MAFFHGVEVLELASGFRTAQQVETAVIGIVGTAPNADVTVFPINTPVLISGSLSEASKLGATGTLPNAISNILAQSGAYIVVVRVTAGASEPETRNNVIGGVDGSGNYTGIQALKGAELALGRKPRILIAPEFTQTRTTGGVLSAPVSNGGTGYATAPTVAFAVPPTNGIRAEGYAVINGSGVVTSIVITKTGAGYLTAPAVSFSGGGGTGAVATSTIGTTRNAVTSALLDVANKLESIVYADCPNTTDADAIQYRNDWDGAGRLEVVDPYVLVDRGDVTPNAEPASSVLAGLRAGTDYKKGYWFSTSSKEVLGIVGTARTIDYSATDLTSRANYLNSNQVTTIIRDGGFKMWGNRSTASDSNFTFTTSRRVSDVIKEKLRSIAKQFQDDPITKQLLDDVVVSFKEELRTMKALGAILDFNVWLDPAVNTPAVLAQGQFYVDYDYKDPLPAERITLRQKINNGYLEDLV
jgi:phage tail sheath protein FI